MPTVTNQQFADAVEVHFSMASRLRNGERRPSLITMRRIAKAYDLPMNELVEAYERGKMPDGRYAIGDYLVERVFGRKEDHSDTAQVPGPREHRVQGDRVVEHHVGSIDLTGTGNPGNG